MSEYGQLGRYLTNNKFTTNEIIGRFTTFLLSGFTIQCVKVLVSTIKGYLRIVNRHYRESGCVEPWDPDDNSDSSILLREQKKFEQEPARRAPLDNKVIVKMHELARSDKLGFRGAVFDFTALGEYGGFRQQEWCMDSKNEIKHYIMPDGTQVVRAFTVKNFIMFDDDNVRLPKPLARRRAIRKLGIEYDVQKNRCNGQIIAYLRLPKEPIWCPVELALNILTRAQVLGSSDPEDPLCVYRDKDGNIQYITGNDVTAYYRFVTKLVMPNISPEELKLISTHFIRVRACVLLHEAGKDGPFIKLRIRWLSDCFQIYLRNTERITAQHSKALSGTQRRMTEMVLKSMGLGQAVIAEGELDLKMDDLEDDD